MTDLSPAALAVLNAVTLKRFNVPWPWSPDQLKSDVAAALEAVADQVVPCEKAPDLMSSPDLERLAQRQHTRAQLLAIAAELRGNTTTTETL